jgi:hypothetical protein
VKVFTPNNTCRWKCSLELTLVLLSPGIVFTRANTFSGESFHSSENSPKFSLELKTPVTVFTHSKNCSAGVKSATRELTELLWSRRPSEVRHARPLHSPPRPPSSWPPVLSPSHCSLMAICCVTGALWHLCTTLSPLLHHNSRAVKRCVATAVCKRLDPLRQGSLLWLTFLVRLLSFDEDFLSQRLVLWWMLPTCCHIVVNLSRNWSLFR